jgi:hypothetical protein
VSALWETACCAVFQGAVGAFGASNRTGSVHALLHFTRSSAQPSTVPDVERLGRHLTCEFPAIWSFLDPSIDTTNWRAEQALRPAIVTHKVCGGNWSWHGADSQ